ncbi:MAG: hypothetical protein KC503_33970 [Myxococcales bacterium]|nr:hypothetical protein [Myxococcales bacterium]
MTLTRRQLYDLAWQTPVSRLAQQFAISDVGLAKICARHDIPRPARGYWAKPSAERPAAPPLPKSCAPDVIEIAVAASSAPPEQSDPLSDRIAEERRAENRIVVSEQLDRPCKLVAEARKLLRGAPVDDVGTIEPPPACLALAVSREQLPRALRLADALVRAFDARGWPCTVTDDTTVVDVKGVAVGLRIEEAIDSERRPVKPDVNAFAFHFNRHETFRTPSGRLLVAIEEQGRRLRRDMHRRWKDTKTRRMEDRLNNVIIGMLRLATAVREEDEDRERRQRAEAERQQQLQAALEEQRRLRHELAAEKQRVALLHDEAVRWKSSDTLRQYIERVRARGAHPQLELAGAELDQWLSWADTQADRMDPFVKSPPSILDDEQRIEHMCDHLKGPPTYRGW